MPRARRTKAAPPTEPPLEFGPPPLELPPPPAKPVAPEPPKGSPPPPELVDLGDPPTDALELQAYGARAVALSMRSAQLDATLTPAQRRREILSHARAIKELTPNSELWQAWRAMREDREQLERVKRGATLEPVPEGTTDARPRK
jgi:hypothetical protein